MTDKIKDIMEEDSTTKLNQKNKNENINEIDKEDDYDFLLFDEKTDLDNLSKKFFNENNKYSMDLNEQKLNEFLNYDYFNSLNKDQIDSNKNFDNSNSSTKEYISMNSDKNSIWSLDNYNNNENLNDKFDCFEEEIIKNNENNKIQKGLSMSTKSDLNNNDIFNNKNNIDKNDIDKIKILNDPQFAPVFIPKKLRTQLEEQKGNREKNDNNNKIIRDMKEIIQTNKFDDNESILLYFINKFEENTKLPLEIRIGDWICLYCNNFNFSFRKRCNRCGLLKQMNCILFEHNYYNNLNSNRIYINCNNNNEKYWNNNNSINKEI